jgi:DNA-binding MarR family transcriptional regulator
MMACIVPSRSAVMSTTPAKPASRASRASRKPADPAAKVRARSGRAPALADDKHAEQAAKVLRRFRVIFNAVKNHFRSVETRAGVSGAQLWALSVINAQPGAGMNQLARAMDVHQSTASNLVRALADAGMVISAREGDDRRAVQLYLTTKGQKALAKAPGPFAGVLPDALLHLDAQALVRLDRDLAALIHCIGAAAGGGKRLMGDDDS